jgi:hypothetical protein
MKQGLLLSAVGIAFLHVTPLLGTEIEGGNVTTRVTPEQTVNIEGASKDFNIQKGMPDPHVEEHFSHQIEPGEAEAKVAPPPTVATPPQSSPGIESPP